MPTETYDCLIVGTGPAGLGAALHLNAQRPELRVLVIDKAKRSTGGLRNDCKMNFTYPVGFPADCWTQAQAEHYLTLVEERRPPACSPRAISPPIASARNALMSVCRIFASATWAPTAAFV